MSSFLPSPTDCCASPCGDSTCVPTSLSDLIAIGINAATRIFIVTSSTYGAVGDGVTDDTDAIQAAVSDACEEGGTVYFPFPHTYAISRQITIASKYPVILLGSSYGYSHNSLTPQCSCILLKASIAGSIFRYESPVASRDAGGGGAVVGLTFRDATASLGLPGDYTVTAALDLHDFNFSLVKDCVFQNINGSAIVTEFCVQTNFTNVGIRYCGASSKPAFWLNGTLPSYVTQSVFINGGFMEANYGDAYLKISSGCGNIKIHGVGFEAQTSEPDSNQNFINVACNFVNITSCHFNRNLTTQLYLGVGTNCNNVSNCLFAGSANNVHSVEMAGTDSGMSNCRFNTGKTALEVLLSGTGNSIVNSSFVNSGAIESSGSANRITGNTMRFGGVYSTADYWIKINHECSAIGNLIISYTGATTGGIDITGTTPIVIGNSLSHFDTAIAIRCNSSNAVVIGNTGHENLTDFSDLTTTVIVENNWFNSTPFREIAYVYNPPSLAAGESNQINVPGITGVALGDYVMVGFTSLLTGIVMTATVIGNGTAQVTFTNISAAPIDMDSGTIKLRGFKAFV